MPRKAHTAKRVLQFKASPASSRSRVRGAAPRGVVGKARSPPLRLQELLACAEEALHPRVRRRQAQEMPGPSVQIRVALLSFPAATCGWLIPEVCRPCLPSRHRSVQETVKLLPDLLGLPPRGGHRRQRALPIPAHDLVQACRCQDKTCRSGLRPAQVPGPDTRNAQGQPLSQN